MQYWTPIFRQRVGRNRTISRGSTSWAITTREAFFFSTAETTRLTPTERTLVRLKPGSSALPAALKKINNYKYSATFVVLRTWKSSSTYLASARAKSRAFFSPLLSGRYFSASLKKAWAVCRSRVWLNWLTIGGTLSRFWRTARCRWSRTYLGHLTKRVKSRLGCTFWPIPKFFGRFSRRGFSTFLAFCFLIKEGAAATRLAFEAFDPFALIQCVKGKFIRGHISHTHSFVFCIEIQQIQSYWNHLTTSEFIPANKALTIAAS